MMDIIFTKMHGLGNDFVVIDGFSRDIELSTEQVRHLSDRHHGVGCDQVLLLSPPLQNGIDVNYRIFNADGNEVSQCGNGARCIAAWLKQRGKVNKDEIIAATSEGTLYMYPQSDGTVRVNMGNPRFAPAEIPLSVTEQQEKYQLHLNGETVDFSAVSMGNPHAVIIVNDVVNTPVDILGPQVQQNKLFPSGVNVGFMQILDLQHIRLRVFERGVGETLACGSGACAAVVTGIMGSGLKSQVDVSLNGGHLLVSWAGESEPVWITGPATFVFEGQIAL